jgi:hypothetical protein
MITAWLSLLAAFVIVRFMRRKTWWLKAHRLAAILGACLVVLGLIVVVLDISMTKREHFAIPHAYVGYAAFVLAAVTPTLGQLQFLIRPRAARIRILHRWSGRVTLAIMVVNILLGLSYVGLI